MNKDLCKQWKKNKNINPLTGRAIKKNGPTYKKIEKMCKKYMSRKEKCRKWKRHKSKNPTTGRKIKKQGPTYKKYEKECLSKKNINRRKTFHELLEIIKKEVKGTQYEKRVEHLLKNDVKKYYKGYKPEKIYRYNLTQYKELFKKLKQTRKMIHPDRFGPLIEKYPRFKKYVERAFRRINMVHMIIDSNIDVLEFFEEDKFTERNIERLIKRDREE